MGIKRKVKERDTMQSARLFYETITHVAYEMAVSGLGSTHARTVLLLSPADLL